jgi:hypothetical protein
MLTDVFADRYAKRVLWEQYTETEARLLTQCFRIIAEQLIPYWFNGKESDTAKVKWKSLHDRLSMELGLDELAPRYYSFQTTMMGKSYTQSGFWTMDKVCKDFVCAKYTGAVSPDRFMKERISFVELAFRLREEELAALNQDLTAKLAGAKLQDQIGPPSGLQLPGSPADRLKGYYDSLNADFGKTLTNSTSGFGVRVHNLTITMGSFKSPLISWLSSRLNGRSGR